MTKINVFYLFKKKKSQAKLYFIVVASISLTSPSYIKKTERSDSGILGILGNLDILVIYPAIPEITINNKII